MASFPTSAKVFTTKNTGDVIQAAHINDQQDEINAIESGYLSGTARLNSSNSTLANLSVSGGSTLATIHVNGGSTFGDLRVAVATPYAQVTASTNVAVANNTLTVLPFDTEDFVSTTGLHSTGGSSNHILIATSSGIWGVSAAIRWLTSSTGVYAIRVRVNDAQMIAENRQEQAEVGTVIQSITTYWRMQTNDYFDLWAYQVTGTTNSLAGNGSTEINGCRASFFKVR